MEFCFEQYADDGQYICKKFHVLHFMFGHICDNFLLRLGHVCDIFDIKLMHGQKKNLTIFVLEILFQYQVTN